MFTVAGLLDLADGVDASRDEGTERDVDQDDDQDVPDHILVNELDLPGQGNKLIERQNAMQAVLEVLDDEGELTAGEIREAVFDDNPASYETERSWWKNCISPGLRELADRGRVELVDPSRGRWASR